MTMSQWKREDNKARYYIMFLHKYIQIQEPTKLVIRLQEQVARSLQTRFPGRPNFRICAIKEYSSL